MNILILLGPPGAGKGSQAQLLKKKLGFAHVSTGDILRENIKQGTELGKQAKVYMDAGTLGPDELMFAMLFERISRDDCKNGVILDGFPRTLAQAEELSNRVGEEDTITTINLKVPEEAILERLCHRRTCSNCSAPYHPLFSPEKSAGKCDRCEGTLIQREDDKKEVVQKRLAVYRENTAPLITYYQEANCLKTIDASQPQGVVQAELLDVLEDVWKFISPERKQSFSLESSFSSNASS